MAKHQAPTATRRQFLQTSAAAAALATTRTGWASGYKSANERPVCAFIGTGIRYESLVTDAIRFGPAAALCDVDGRQLRNAAGKLDSAYESHGVAAPRYDLCEDYRRILDRSDIDVVVIATPDHWHTKIAIEALLAGKDVYCEKPLTHHVAEGRRILAALDRTKRVMQVGTQQRSGGQFQTAVALARAERVGKVKRVTCGINDSPSCDPLPMVGPPGELNWNRWLGPAPWADYREAPSLPEGGYGSEHPYSRCHAHFRWWYEYAGGKLTDWGAHHVDIGMWALDKSDASIGRYTIEPRRVSHPIEMDENGYPKDDDRFNTATNFDVHIVFEDGVELDIVDYSQRLDFGNGIMFECEDGRFFVNRGKLTGKPAEELKENPLPESVFEEFLGDSVDPAKLSDDESHEARGGAHMKNFMQCVKTREKPISDVASHHRNLTVCHVSNIALRLGRKLTFDPVSERFVDDPKADELLEREYRKGYEIES
ncbi:Gfo/Idh/MocA family oxidoreductase [Botrimarina sp.]|uniref:Gfo/Idh/MocA family protein n=1 Tax=Botrimarina sp. TaxID=2795802 RepID=UPI0032EBC0D4